MVVAEVYRILPQVRLQGPIFSSAVLPNRAEH